MAITTPALTGKNVIEKEAPFAVNYSSGNFIGGSLAAELKAAPTRDGSAIYITHVTMSILKGTSTIEDAALTLLGGDGATLFGPIQLQSNGDGLFSRDFDNPMKVADKKALDVSGVGPGGSYQAAVFVFIEGFIGDTPIV